MQSQSSAPRWTLGDYVGLIGGLAGVLSAVAAGVAGCEAVRSRKIAEEAQVVSQKTYDRAAGKIAARFSLERFSPAYDEIPQAYKVRSPLGTEEVKVKSLENLRALDPYIIVRNTGDEAIDAIRVETKTPLIALHDPTRPGEKQWAAIRPWAVKQADVDDYQLTKKLQPGQRARVPLIGGIVSQMSKNYGREYQDKDHYGQFEIQAYARLVGANSFDEARYSPAVLIKVMWVPADIPEAKCKEFLQASKPTVEVLDER